MSTYDKGAPSEDIVCPRWKEKRVGVGTSAVPIKGGGARRLDTPEKLLSRADFVPNADEAD